jgi:histone H3/H4
MTGVIVKSKVREIVKRIDTEGIVNNVANGVEEELEIKVNEILEKAIGRAKANQRRTLFARDL